MTSKGVDTQSLKHCEDNANAFFACLNKEDAKGDFNVCRRPYSDLKACAATAEKEEPHKEGEADKSLSSVLQAAMPRVFKNVEDLPRERTILADTLAKVAPHIFDPKNAAGEIDDDE
eukprot:Phypoly_transcript_18921.p1 GENE.Phypoly_transcript_18921~~Phypoly_transcript_18921.p1  ORF type:complete len:117 (+),score=26.32 Phypoly_transcript_18921:74-424(+)